MKKYISLIFVVLAISTLIACKEDTGYAGVYTGYSWSGEATGVTFEESTQYIETKLTLDKDGIIIDYSMDFKVKKNDVWISRLDQESTVTIDYNVVPTTATIGESYMKGTSMFTVSTQDFMSFYAFGVNAEGVIALAIVDPVTRFMFETRLDSSFDFSQPISSLTVSNGLNVPTTRLSSYGLVKPTTWDSYQEKNIFNVHYFSHVLIESGIFLGITQSSTVKELIEALGITFVNNVPQATETTYGYFGLGGWKGNYESIAEFLIGKDATKLTSLVDWTVTDYALGINDENYFGIDIQTGGTKTAQNSFDMIAGATVRMSRESTSFQRALLEAGIITEDQVIIGRF